MEWQPIETAPKDGSAILLLAAAYDVPDGDGNDYRHPARAHIGIWDPKGDSWTDESGGFIGKICTLTVTGSWTSGGGWFQPNEVTHWMPLPPPPTSASA